jgi:hypothetical protein
MKKFAIVVILILCFSGSAKSANLDDLKRFFYNKIDYAYIHFWDNSNTRDGKAVHRQQFHMKKSGFFEKINLSDGKYNIRIDAWSNNWQNINQKLFETPIIPIEIKNSRIVRLDIDYHLHNDILLPVYLENYKKTGKNKLIDIEVVGDKMRKGSRGEYRDKKLYFYIYYSPPFSNTYLFTVIVEGCSVEVSLDLEDIISAENNYIEITRTKTTANNFSTNPIIGGESINIPRDYKLIQDGIKHLLASKSRSGVIEISEGIYDQQFSITGPADITIKSNGNTTIKSVDNVIIVKGGNTKVVLERLNIIRKNNKNDSNLLYSEAAIFSEMGPSLIVDNCEIKSNQIGISTNYNKSSKILNSRFLGFAKNKGTGIKICNSNEISEHQGALVGANSFSNMRVGIDISDTQKKVDTLENKFTKCNTNIKRRKNEY